MSCLERCKFIFLAEPRNYMQNDAEGGKKENDEWH